MEIYEAKFRALLDASPVPHAIIDYDRNVLYLNPAFIASLGYTTDEIPTLAQWWPLAYPDVEYRTLIQNQWEGMVAESKACGKPMQSMEVRIACKDGSAKYFVVSTAFWEDSGHDYILVTLFDVSEKVHAVQALEDSRNVLQTIIDTIPLRLFWKNRDLIYMGCNQSFAQDAGKKDPEDVIGKDDTNMAWHQLASQYQADDRKVIESEEEILSYEEPVIGPDGKVGWLRTSKAPLYNVAEKIIGILGVYEDITEQKRLREHERSRNLVLEKLTQGAALTEILQLIMQSVEQVMPHAICSIDLLDRDRKTFRCYTSYSAAEFFQRMTEGTEPLPKIYPWRASMQGKQRKFIANIATAQQDHPLQPLAMQAELKSYWGEPIAAAGELCGLLSIYHKSPASPGDLEIALVENSANLAAFAISRKHMDEALKLAEMVYQHAGEPIIVTNEKNEIVSINPAFVQVTGFSEQEVLGKNPKLWSTGKHDRIFYKEMWKSILTTGQWRGEILNRRKGGEEYAEWVSINTIYDENGAPYRRLAIYQDISERKNQEKIIWDQANFDVLTRLPNRRLFTGRLQQEIKKSRREDSQLALFYIDLDRFKEINDTLGHGVGDKLLVSVAERIQNCVRDSDTVARLGGDEFTLIVPHLREISDSTFIADSIIQSLGRSFTVDGHQFYVSASIGVTVFPHDGDDAPTLLRNADQAMYAAKKAGKGRYSFFTEHMQKTSQQRAQLIQDIHKAIQHNEFQVYFQPIIELDTDAVTKAEALLRWPHPEYGFISPADFIPVAEEIGAIVQIGNMVFEQTLQFIKTIKEKFNQDLQVSVNVSPVQFMSVTDLAQKWATRIHEAGLSANNILIEITEGVILSADPQITDSLLAFRKDGVEIAIDDFGTGYSSLSYLKKLDVDYLKIDRSFIMNLGNDANDLALSEAIIVMAHKLGLRVVAEGVETQAQRNILAHIDCDYVQGYLYAKALPPEEFEAFLASILE